MAAQVSTRKGSIKQDTTCKIKKSKLHYIKPWQYKKILNPFYARLTPGKKKDKNGILDYNKQEQKLWL